MTKLVWDEVGEHLFETGVAQGVLYPWDSELNKYGNGVAWNGITAITESPSGAEASPMFADNIKYLNLISAEEFAATIEAYTYPDEFLLCDGTGQLVPGINVGQQPRKTFGLAYVTKVGNDVEGDAFGYKIHLIYGGKAAPSERGYATVNDSPEAVGFSWEISTTPVAVEGFKPTASLVIDSTKMTTAEMTAIEDKLFGSTGNPATLLLPDEITALLDALV